MPPNKVRFTEGPSRETIFENLNLKAVPVLSVHDLLGPSLKTALPLRFRTGENCGTEINAHWVKKVEWLSSIKLRLQLVHIVTMYDIIIDTSNCTGTIEYRRFELKK